MSASNVETGKQADKKTQENAILKMKLREAKKAYYLLTLACEQFQLAVQQAGRENLPYLISKLDDDMHDIRIIAESFSPWEDYEDAIVATSRCRTCRHVIACEVDVPPYCFKCIRSARV